jgi:hypothetical protein
MHNKAPFQTIAETLAENISRIQYGETAVALKVHAGRVVSVTYSMTENTRHALSAKDTGKESEHGRIE